MNMISMNKKNINYGVAARVISAISALSARQLQIIKNDRDDEY